jgi:thymidylate kinase
MSSPQRSPWQAGEPATSARIIRGAAPKPPAPVPGAVLLHQLRDALDARGIRYCQWKGHWNPERWASGEGDVDLLVARQDSAAFEHAVSGIGLKHTVAPAWRQVPALTSYYGFDPGIRRFLHIHVHYQVPLGDDWTMNYQLPIEAPLLSTSVPGPFFRIPAPELEFIIFVTRMVLAESLVSTLVHRRELPSRRRAAEWRYLAGRVDHGKVHLLLTQHLPAVRPDVFDRCVRSLSPLCPLVSRLRVKRELQRALEAHTRRTPLVNTLRRVSSRAGYATRRVTGGRNGHNALATGGAIVALVGGDGAGKTTAVNDLVAWASAGLDTATVHLGKPERSLTTLAVAVVRRIAPMQTLLLVRSVCIARDRYRVYARARRDSARGRLVICDRFPTPLIDGMDGPNIRVPADGNGHRVARWLQQIEQSYYDRICSPDLLIVLRVDPEVAAMRKVDEPADYVRTRTRLIWETDFTGTKAFVVDANRQAADVAADLRSLVWSQL